MNIPERIAALRALMKTEGLDAYITLNGDPHAGEYVARHYTMRTWLSGFTGSAGTLVVTMEKAALWTDGRYVVQGKQNWKAPASNGADRRPKALRWKNG